MIKPVFCLAVAFTLAACAQPKAGSPSEPGPGKIVFTGDQKTDWAQVTALEDQAKTIVKTSALLERGRVPDGTGGIASVRRTAVLSGLLRRDH